MELDTLKRVLLRPYLFTYAKRCRPHPIGDTRASELVTYEYRQAAKTDDYLLTVTSSLALATNTNGLNKGLQGLHACNIKQGGHSIPTGKTKSLAQFLVRLAFVLLLLTYVFYYARLILFGY